MKDKAFLQWLHSRFINIHGEDPSYDYMLKLSSIIESTPDDQHTPNNTSCELYEQAGVTFEYKD